MHYPIGFMARVFFFAAAFAYALSTLSADPKQTPEDTLFDAHPKVPYPGEAREKPISGTVTARIVVQNGQIVNVTATGPELLASASSKWIKSRWKAKAGVTETYVEPIEFGIGQGVGLLSIAASRQSPTAPYGTSLVFW